MDRPFEMAKIALETFVHASPERCFDLARDLDLHVRSMHASEERAVAGKTSGLIGPGEEVTWEARHFGVVHRHRSQISAYNRPHHFQDIMLEGRFTRFQHDHYFDANDGGTTMRDVIEFESPFGLVGRLIDRLFLTRYLTNLIQTRNETIRQEAEATEPYS